ncbi:pheromone-regulated protein prm10 [Massospora cicadina]|nr:pheromone-regulated protein prm10 [Massospora cicadina]
MTIQGGRVNVTFSLGAESDEEVESEPRLRPTVTPSDLNIPSLRPSSRLLTPTLNSPRNKGLVINTPTDSPVDTPLPTPGFSPIRPTPLRCQSVPRLDAKEATTIQVDPIRTEAKRLVKGVTGKTTTPKNASTKRGILSNLLQLHHANKSKSELKPNRKSFLTPNLSSQSLQAFFGLGSARSSFSDEGVSGSERKVAAAIESILKRQRFLCDLARAFILYGAPSHRMEANLCTAAQTLDVDASFASLPGLMFISFTCQETHTSETVLLRVSPGYDMHKLDRAVNIYQRVVKEDLLLADADVELQQVLSTPPLYPPWAELLSYGVGAFGSASMLFGGGIREAGLAGGLGLLVGLLALLARRFASYTNIFELTSAILCAFVATALRDHVCYWPVVLSATVHLLPGLALTVAVMDLASKNMVSGSVRLFYALLAAFILGFGLSLGNKLWFLTVHSSATPLDCGPERAMPFHFRTLMFIPASISFNVYLLAHPRQWPPMMLTAFLAFLSSYFLPQYVSAPDFIPAVSAMVVGIFSNLYARFTATIPLVPLLGSILLLVPGSLSVKLTANMLEPSSLHTESFALTMIVAALAIAIGLFASTMIIFPLGRRRSALMTF